MMAMRITTKVMTHDVDHGHFLGDDGDVDDGGDHDVDDDDDNDADLPQALLQVVLLLL